MRGLRGIAAATLLWVAAGVSAECVTAVVPLWTSQSAPSLERGPVAWTGTRLAVASSEPQTKAIWVSTYAEDGSALTAPLQIVSAAARPPLELIWNGSELGLFYVSADQRLMLQRLSADGVPAGAPLQVAAAQVKLSDEIDIAWSAAADAYVIARTSGTARLALYASIVERNGLVRRDLGWIDSPYVKPNLRVAISDSGVAGVFYRNSGGDRLMYARISGDRTYATIHDLSSVEDEFVVTSHHNLFVIVKAVRDSEQRVTLRWGVFDTSGQIVQPDALLLTPSGSDVVPAAVAGAGSELALAYIDAAQGRTQPSNYRLRRWTLEGDLISDTFFAASRIAAVRASSPYPFAWTGTSFLQVVANLRDERPVTHFVRYCPLRSRVIGPSYVRTGRTVELEAETKGGVADYIYSWTFRGRRRATGKVVQHTFTTPGTESVTLTVTDGSGVVQSTTLTVTVKNGRTRAVGR